MLLSARCTFSLLFILLCTHGIFPQTVNAQSDPSQGSSGRGTGSMYAIHPLPLGIAPQNTLTQASQICEAEGRQLAVPDTSQKANKMSAYMNANAPNDEWVLLGAYGLRCADNISVFFWTTTMNISEYPIPGTAGECDALLGRNGKAKICDVTGRTMKSRGEPFYRVDQSANASFKCNGAINMNYNPSATFGFMEPPSSNFALVGWQISRVPGNIPSLWRTLCASTACTNTDAGTITSLNVLCENVTVMSESADNWWYIIAISGSLVSIAILLIILVVSYCYEKRDDEVGAAWRKDAYNREGYGEREMHTMEKNGSGKGRHEGYTTASLADSRMTSRMGSYSSINARQPSCMGGPNDFPSLPRQGNSAYNGQPQHQQSFGNENQLNCQGSFRGNEGEFPSQQSTQRHHSFGNGYQINRMESFAQQPPPPPSPPPQQQQMQRQVSFASGRKNNHQGSFRGNEGEFPSQQPTQRQQSSGNGCQFNRMGSFTQQPPPPPPPPQQQNPPQPQGSNLSGRRINRHVSFRGGGGASMNQQQQQ